MKLRWTKPATEDMAAIVRYIRRDNITAAKRVKQVISAELSTLPSMPDRGRIGIVHDTREIVFSQWSYIAVYRVYDGEIHILRIRHAAQNWP